MQADHRLAGVLDGIYHRGEVYLRWLQRFSLLAFGTQVGRFLTRYFALPFGGAFVILFGLYHLIVDIAKIVLQVPKDQEKQFEAALPAPLKALEDPLTIGLLGIFLFLLLHVPSFRRAVVDSRLVDHDVGQHEPAGVGVERAHAHRRQETERRLEQPALRQRQGEQSAHDTRRMRAPSDESFTSMRS